MEGYETAEQAASTGKIDRRTLSPQ